MKRLCELIDCVYSVPISGIKTDSRKVQKGDLFVAVKGYNVDHSLYINDAIEKGAIAVIGEDDNVNINSIYIKVDDINKTLFNLLSNFYDHIENDFKFIGITGTDGKTTTATITANILDCCYIGTNGVTYRGKSWNSNNTTPEICDMYDYLVKLKELGCKTVVMEVSSEALLHRRVDNFKFDIVCFTNITEDHLNVHKTLENYISSKKKLFSLVRENGISILNIDDNNYLNVKKCCKYNVYSYGKSDNADFKICKINCQKNSTNFMIIHKDSTYIINSKLFGVYNIYNITLAFTIAYLYGIQSKSIIKKISDIDSVSGRGEFIDFGQNYTIILDYAHTYNGIYNIIMNLKNFNYSKIIVVTGAAGGREVEKRSKIGEMLLKNVDYVIFTMDDPRNEDVNKIIDQLTSTTNLNNYERVIDRSFAIEKALSLAKDDYLVLIIGKGRDNYMAVGDEKIPYCDYDVIKSYFIDS